MFYPNANTSFISPSQANFSQFPFPFIHPYQFLAMSQQFSQMCKLQEYEKNYGKIFDLLKSKYKKQISPTLSLDEVSRCSSFLFENQKRLNDEEMAQGFSKCELKRTKLYCFLSTLTFFEVDSNKSHDLFVPNFFLKCKPIEL